MSSKKEKSKAKSNNLVSSQIMEMFFRLYDDDGILEEKLKKKIKPRKSAQDGLQQELDLFPDLGDSKNS
ncbi:MAG: hypothetical protein Q8934_10750 [Bacillota bacterium]|nr:hypothetical protein [Bacillota bacterium]